MTSALFIVGNLVLLLSGWPILGYVYYRHLKGLSPLQARYRALITLVLALIIGKWFDTSASLRREDTIRTYLVRSLAWAWWGVPYVLALAIVVTKRRKTTEQGPVNQAL